MPHHKSAVKRVRTNAKANARNVAARTRVRSAVKAVRTAQSREQALVAYRNASSVLDRTVAKGIIKKGTADRQKARLVKFAEKLPA